MYKLKQLALVVSASVVLSGAASAKTIDFESAARGTYSSLSIADVTFSYLGGAKVFAVTAAEPGYPVSGHVLLSSGVAGHSSMPFLATIAGGASIFSIGAGDYGRDDDMIFLKAYDLYGRLIDADEFLITRDSYVPGVNAGHVLSVNSQTSNIAYVHFGSLYENPGSVYWDNVNYLTAPIPEPETYAMMLAGLGLLGLSARRRRKPAAG